jgi:hypothetical protein
VIKDNLFVANGPQTGAVDTRVLLGLQGPQASIIATTSNNLFWAPGAMGMWVNGYAYVSSDIHTTCAYPVFVDKASGNFTLQPTSAGVAAASDGTNMGIQYNASLKLAWLQSAFALPTQQLTDLTTSANITVDPNHWYQVWFYVPTWPFNGLETFVVEGTSLVRDIATLHSNTTWTQPGGPARWITLGRHKATDGTLTITWTHPTSANQIFVRQLPTAAEAYLWVHP